MHPPMLATSALLLAMLLPRAAIADPAWLRALDVTALPAHTLALSATAELQSAFDPVPLSGGTGRYQGPQWGAIARWVGAGPWQLGLDAAVRQVGLGQFHSGATVPSVAFRLSEMGALTPFAVATVRTRIGAARGTTATVGLGMLWQPESWRGAMRVDYEAAGLLGQEAGLRYEAALAWRSMSPVIASVEAWGNSTSATSGGERGAHHIGVGVLRVFSGVSIGLQCGVGVTLLTALPDPARDGLCFARGTWTFN